MPANSFMLRFILIAILFFASLLCVFRAPMYYIWYVAILVSEFSWIFILAVGGLLLWKTDAGIYRTTGTALGIIALLLYAFPIAGAYSLSGSIDNEFHKVFKPKRNKQAASYSFLQTFKGINATSVPYKTFTYASYPGKSLPLDFYPSQQAGKRPSVIVVHGGSWAAGDRKQLPELNSYLALQGYHVAAINYRLAPQYHCPAPVEDINAAIAYLSAHAVELNIDTARFVLLGRSAGGEIVLNAAYTLHNPAIKGVISYYGPADLVWGYANPANPLVLNSCKVIEDYLGGTYQQMPRQYEFASAPFTVTKDAPPTLLIQGKTDALVAYGHSPRLIEKLKPLGVKYYFLSLPWATHGCDYSLNGPSGQLCTYTVLRFLDAVTKD